MPIKKGVDIRFIRAESVIALMEARDVFRKHGYDIITLTSGLEGKHGKKSFHYEGRAIDLQTRHIASEEKKEEIARDVKIVLGAQFDIVLHPYVDDEHPGHLHIEFDPKEE